MNDTLNEQCPRCGGAFHCGVADDTPCACGQIALSAAAVRQLRERYASCLCLRCLAEVAAEPPPGPGQQT